MACHSGIAPVKAASGKSVRIHLRWACPKFLRQTFHELTKSFLPFCAWAQCYYQMQIQRGKGRQAAIRALAFKWQRIMWRCWQDHLPYDDAKYLTSLKRSASDLYAKLAAAPAKSIGEQLRPIMLADYLRCLRRSSFCQQTGLGTTWHFCRDGDGCAQGRARSGGSVRMRPVTPHPGARNSCRKRAAGFTIG